MPPRGVRLTQSKLEKAVLVEATLQQVWRAWTTVEGVKTFFAPDARIELRPNGRYEILFDLEAPEGSRGSEGCKILSYAPESMLSFSWGAPPKFEKSRAENAQWVVLFFLQVGDGRTLVRLLEFGWKDTEESEQVYDYFDKAWPSVLSSLAQSFVEGPIDWNSLRAT
jgi:uncharacterized protein YndB with AHSA1/START domain